MHYCCYFQNIYLRGYSGFTDVMLYEKLESNGVSYAIRLKESKSLREAVAHIRKSFMKSFRISCNCQSLLLNNPLEIQEAS
jgi:hypothetical protein